MSFNAKRFNRRPASVSTPEADDFTPRSALAAVVAAATGIAHREWELSEPPLTEADYYLVDDEDEGRYGYEVRYTVLLASEDRRDARVAAAVAAATAGL
jgi:hypothetical protein